MESRGVSAVDPSDLEVLAAIEEGLPLVPEPYGELGKKIGMREEEIMDRILRMQRDGVIRRFRARINQRLLGVTANALVAWECTGRSEEVSRMLASFPGVTHCYERKPVPGKWEYSLYTVHHGFSREDVEDEVRAIAQKAGLSRYLILFSTEEFKRVPNVRIRENGDGR